MDKRVGKLARAAAMVVAFGLGVGVGVAWEAHPRSRQPPRVLLVGGESSPEGQATGNLLVSHLRAVVVNRLGDTELGSDTAFQWKEEADGFMYQELEEVRPGAEELAAAIRAANREVELHAGMASLFCRMATREGTEDVYAALVDVGCSSSHESLVMTVLAGLWKEQPEGWLEAFTRWVRPDKGHPDFLAVSFLERTSGQDWGVTYPPGAEQDFVTAKRQAYEYARARLKRDSHE